MASTVYERGLERSHKEYPLHICNLKTLGPFKSSTFYVIVTFPSYIMSKSVQKEISKRLLLFSLLLLLLLLLLLSVIVILLLRLIS